MDFKVSLILDLSVNPPLGPHYIRPMVESLNLQLLRALNIWFSKLTSKPQIIWELDQSWSSQLFEQA